MFQSTYLSDAAETGVLEWCIASLSLRRRDLRHQQEWRDGRGSVQPQYCPVQTPSTNSLKDSLFAPFAKLGVYGGLSGIKVQDRAVPESRPARDLATLSYPTEGITPFWTPRLFNVGFVTLSVLAASRERIKG